ncbi:SRPBCC family protein [Terrabacter sp. C0L_2]|uniref:SRPBCC family protein n=1 Tax=Terrabacter sp. C0L_2 TaxID=3108389 RepID=UPI002ECFC48D|nr:SRPBCC family protein [Terrabacter sp. C0L_2]
MEIERSVTVGVPVDRVFAYLSDFTNTTEWDPGTVSTERVSGDGGLGTRYRNVSKFLGRETELDYLVIEHVPGERFALRGENATVVANDTMTFVRTVTGGAGDGGAAAEGTTVTYRADFEFKGVAKLAAPLLAPAFKKLGDEAEQGMRDALNRLG